MEVVLDYWYRFQDFYAGCLDRADPRVENWFLMQSYTPTLVLTALYLLIVWGGLKFMKNRDAVPIHRYIIFIYNAGLVALNFYICYEVFVSTWLENYSYSCTPVDYSNNPNAIRLAKALWWYYFSKCIEFMDTFIFIIRKKNNQVSFLHVYHHATMFPIWWMGVKWVPGGQSFFGAMINSFIHVVMYTYYGISALGPQYQKFLWWKKYLTTMQLVQFVTGMFHSAQSLAIGCNFPAWMQWALICYGGSIFSLFMNFYYHSYVKKGKKGEGQANGSTKVKNGHKMANGKAESKKVK